MRKFSIIVAYNSKRGIGYNNTIPWSLSSDLKYFKKITTTTISSNKINAIIMGRKTFQSLQFKPLKNRLNIVISKNYNLELPNVIFVSSIQDAFNILDKRIDIEEVFVIGGESIYKETILLPNCSKIYVTFIEQPEFLNLDTYFPVIPETKFYKNFESELIQENGISYRFLEYNTKIIFTRYLYLKDEVEISLLLALLDKKEDALFWAYELYYSGFQKNLFDLLFKYYYEFYYSLNPNFEDFITTKYNLFFQSKDENEKNKIIAILVNNLLLRPYNLDLFICIHCKTELENIDIKTELKRENYNNIVQFILNENEYNINLIFEEVIDYFISVNIKINKKTAIQKWNKNKHIYLNKGIILCARIFNYYSLLKGLKMGKNFYVLVEDEDIVVYENIIVDLNNKFKAYKVLSTATILPINLISIFELKRESVDIQNEYWKNWLYWSSFSLLWFSRIEKYGGKINHKTKKVEFMNDDLMEEFYTQYGYEPDEQTLEVQERNIGSIKNIEWINFYENYKNNGFYCCDKINLLGKICL